MKHKSTSGFVLDIGKKLVCTVDDYIVPLVMFYSDVKELLDMSMNIEIEDFIEVINEYWVNIHSGWTVSDAVLQRIGDGTMCIGDTIYTSTGGWVDPNNELKCAVAEFLAQHDIAAHNISGDMMVLIINKFKIHMAIYDTEIKIYTPDLDTPTMAKCGTVIFNMYDPESFPSILELVEKYKTAGDPRVVQVHRKVPEFLARR